MYPLSLSSKITEEIYDWDLSNQVVRNTFILSVSDDLFITIFHLIQKCFYGNYFHKNSIIDAWQGFPVIWIVTVLYLQEKVRNNRSQESQLYWKIYLANIYSFKVKNNTRILFKFNNKNTRTTFFLMFYR